MKAYSIDLVRLAWMYFHMPDEEIGDFIRDMRSSVSATSSLAGQDMESILTAPSRMAAVRRVRHKFETFPIWRLSPEIKSFLDNNLVATSSYHSNDVQAIAHASLASKSVFCGSSSRGWRCIVVSILYRPQRLPRHLGHPKKYRDLSGVRVQILWSYSTVIQLYHHNILQTYLKMMLAISQACILPCLSPYPV